MSRIVSRFEVAADQPMSRPARSLIANGPIGRPKSKSTRSTSHGIAPSKMSFCASRWRWASMRLPTKPCATPTTTPTLPILGASLTMVASTRFRGLRAAHDFEQAHHIGGREEMRADHVFRPPGLGGDRVDVKVGGVGGEDRAGLGDLVEPLEHALLDLHVLEHRFDHEVGVGQRLEVERRREPRHPLLDLRHRHAALLGRVLVVPAHDRNAAVERLFRGLDDGHGNAGREEIHRDAAAHRAGADHADLGDRPRRLVRRRCPPPSPPAARRKRHSAAPWTAWSRAAP